MADMALFDEFRGYLKKVHTMGELVNWFRALKTRVPAWQAASVAIQRWIDRLSTYPATMTLVQAEKEVGNLYFTADNVLHQVAGVERSFDPTWSETLMNAAKAGGHAVRRTATAVAETAEKTGKAAVEGATWALYLLPVALLLGVGVYAAAKA